MQAPMVPRPTRDEAQEVIDELKAERAAARAERNAAKEAAEAEAAQAVAAAVNCMWPGAATQPPTHSRVTAVS